VGQLLFQLLHLQAKPRIIPRCDSMVSLTGPLATASRESRQARKGATVVVTLCAEVWLVRVTAIIFSLPYLSFLTSSLVILNECEESLFELVSPKSSSTLIRSAPWLLWFPALAKLALLKQLLALSGNHYNH